MNDTTGTSEATETFTQSPQQPEVPWRLPGVWKPASPRPEGLVPLGAEIVPQPGVPTTGFRVNSGNVIFAPRVFDIFWGRDWGDSATGTVNAAATKMSVFTEMLLHSRYMETLQQYKVSTGTHLGSTWIDHDPTTAETKTQNEMLSLLIQWMNDGKIPEVPSSDDAEHIYNIYVPSEVSLTLNGLTNFCAYHWWGHYNVDTTQKANLFFGVMRTSAGTDAVAHEIAETCTDRDGTAWKSTDAGTFTEIGDVCSACGSGTLTLNGSKLASYWLVEEARCLQQDDVKALSIEISPPPSTLHLKKPATFTITTADQGTMGAVDGATAVVYNYGRRGGGPYMEPVPGQGPSLTYTTTFYPGKQIVFDEHGHPHAEFDLSPYITVSATGFRPVVLNLFPDL